MRSWMLVTMAVCGVLLGACASDPERRAPTAPLFSLRTVDAHAAEVAVAAADLPPAARPAGAPPVGDPAVQVPAAGPDATRVYTIEVRFVRPGGAQPEVLSAPRLTVYPNQRANISVVNQISFVQDFDAEIGEEHVIADPVVGVLQHGLTLEVVTAPVAGTDRAVDVAFKLLLAELEEPIRQRTVRFAPWTSDGTIQLPRLALSSSAGVRRIGVGEEVTVAELPDVAAGRWIDVRMRVVPDVLPAGTAGATESRAIEDFVAPDLVESASADGGEGDPDLKRMLASARSRNHAGGRLALEPVVVELDLDPGVAVAEESLRDARVLQIAALRVHTTPVPGAGASALLQESYVSDYEVLVGKTDYAVADPVVDTFLSGITGTVVDDALLRLEWTTTPSVADLRTAVLEGLVARIDVPERRTHAVTVPLRAGRQLVPIARLADGGSAAVWVSFLPE